MSGDCNGALFVSFLKMPRDTVYSFIIYIFHREFVSFNCVSLPDVTCCGASGIKNRLCYFIDCCF